MPSVETVPTDPIPTGPGTDVTPVQPQEFGQPSTGPLGGALPIADAPFGYFGPHPFAPNPFLAEGYSRGGLFEPNLTRGRFQSDHAFDGFVRPMTNPILAQDPRANTFGRFIFVNNNFPGGDYPTQGGNAQFYFFQAGLALSERFEVAIQRGGFAQYGPALGADRFGGLDMAFAAKYTFYRDVENQCLAAAGLILQVPTGDADVFEGKNGGLYTPYVTYGVEFCDDWHFLATHGVQLPGNHNKNGTFFYHSLHFDRNICNVFYPFFEANYFQYTADGNLVPPPFGEGDGLANYGTQDHAWKQTLNMAGGGRFVIHDWVQFGAAYVFPVSHRKDILNNRVVVELMVRY
jgi:hypothetical protein